jgi:hypothetical protein
LLASNFPDFASQRHDVLNPLRFCFGMLGRARKREASMSQVRDELAELRPPHRLRAASIFTLMKRELWIKLASIGMKNFDK